MKSIRSLLGGLALGATALSAVPASGATITGGTTAVTLTSAPTLTALGLTVAPTGTATVAIDGSGLPVATFPITGGTIAGGNAIIEHVGSGLLFTAGTSSLEIGNFRINTASSLLTGDAIANGTALGVVPLFTIGAGSTLLLTAQGSGAFRTVFNADVAAGTQIGVAAVNPIAAAVPEPATWGLMILGFGAVGAALRRRTSVRVRFAHT